MPSYWITNGIYSDYFMVSGKHIRRLRMQGADMLQTAVRTGGADASGISMILIPRLPGLQTRKIEVGIGGISATTYVTFEDVKVPARYLVGKEGEGFKYTMSNFNHERLWIAFQAIRSARICLQDAMDWCKKREAFNKTLIEQPVVRHKFGHMGRQIDALQNWIESIVYELDNMSHAQGDMAYIRRSIYD
jgi:alkylation response protein AidB-like acyl-CoA dehydrogenase